MPYRPTDDEVVYSKRLGDKFFSSRFASIKSSHCDLRRTRRSKIHTFSIMRVQNKILLEKNFRHILSNFREKKR